MAFVASGRSVSKAAAAGEQFPAEGEVEASTSPGTSLTPAAPGAFDALELLVDAGARAVDGRAHRLQLFRGRASAVLLQPQALAQHLLQRGAHGVVAFAGDGLDLAARRAQAVLERVGGIQHAGQGLPVTGKPGPAAQQEPASQGRGKGEHQQRQGQVQGPPGRQRSLPGTSDRGKLRVATQVPTDRRFDRGPCEA